ncbi:MAG: bifunctional (p)ppGpp synthetase/guanosine-3',5'-bis(diphosphate) 3'-pyrophosphohydrolase [Proteobacteria bacterium]|nr:MAG: bifunctional (p)ppGpp synthetase/guanosine-3',5'-bis(diphosphate) 3'-pyrophosphohydrolase [Pseudomonadota bacterium]
MLKRHESFNSIYDIFEIKIIVDTIGDCYLALGVIHNLYQPIPGKFKDYIAVPKNNGYQSLHSTMMGPKGRPLQIHIRTKEMEEIAEQGIVSHWLKQQQGINFNKAKHQTSNWLNNILDIQSSTFSASDFLDNIKKDLSPRNIYVFTPRGKILHLPQNATPVDFAYAIHTDIGDHCHRAKVNQRYVPLNYKLQNGDIVDILTTPDQEPDSEWLNFVTSGRAISKIKQYLKEQKFDVDVTNGIQLLNKGLQIAGYSDSFDNSSLKNAIEENYPRVEYADLMQKLGAGDIPVLRVVQTLLKLTSNQPLSLTLSNCSIPILQDEVCCPLPGETILARLTRRGKLELHRERCNKNKLIGLDNLTPVTIINDNETKFLAKVMIVIDNLPGTFSKLSIIIAERKINMEEIFQERTEDHAHVVARLTITTHALSEIDDLLNNLSEHDFVIKAVRT